MLAGGAAALFGQVLGPLYLAGRVYRNAATYANDGSLTRGETPAACLVQVDAATERMIATEGYTATDRALYLLRSSYDGAFDTDCEIAVDEGPYAGSRWKVAAPIDGDPAGAYWLCRGVRQKAAP
jgi:hypothetical protein